jgi:hypothetical protein
MIAMVNVLRRLHTPFGAHGPSHRWSYPLHCTLGVLPLRGRWHQMRCSRPLRGWYPTRGRCPCWIGRLRVSCDPPLSFPLREPSADIYPNGHMSPKYDDRNYGCALDCRIVGFGGDSTLGVCCTIGFWFTSN